MAGGQEIEHALTSLQHMLRNHDYSNADSVLANAKALLLQAKALIPSLQLQKSNPQALRLAREILECGALITIRRKDAEGFIRYVKQLQSFYDFNAFLRETGELHDHPTQRPAHQSNRSHHGHHGNHSQSGHQAEHDTQESKIIGLYLLLLLIQRDNAGFHMMIEKLEMADGGKISKGGDPYIDYPIKMEQWLSEGVYDRVWKATTGHNVPSEEFSLFTDVLHNTIRTEIASCAAKSYPSLKLSKAKTMLFLSSDKAATDFANAQGWTLHDGRIYFPKQDEERSEKDILVASGSVIENTIGYTRNLEQIV